MIHNSFVVIIFHKITKLTFKLIFVETIYSRSNKVAMTSFILITIIFVHICITIGLYFMSAYKWKKNIHLFNSIKEMYILLHCLHFYYMILIFVIWSHQLIVFWNVCVCLQIHFYYVFIKQHEQTKCIWNSWNKQNITRLHKLKKKNVIIRQAVYFSFCYV